MSKLLSKAGNIFLAHRLLAAVVALSLIVGAIVASPMLADGIAGDQAALSVASDDANPNPPILSFRQDEDTGAVYMFNHATGEETLVAYFGTASGKLIHIDLGADGKLTVDVPEGITTVP